MIEPVAKEATMNKAEAADPKTGHSSPAGKSFGASAAVGSMKSADMDGAFSSAHTPLRLK